MIEKKVMGSTVQPLPPTIPRLGCTSHYRVFVSLPHQKMRPGLATKPHLINSSDDISTFPTTMSSAAKTHDPHAYTSGSSPGVPMPGSTPLTR